MENVKENVAENAPQPINVIEHITAETIVYNLALWLDIAIAKGRMIDAQAQAKKVEDVMPETDKDKE